MEDLTNKLENSLNKPIFPTYDSESKSLSLKGRKAVCNMCGVKRDSSYDLFLFHHIPEYKTDSFYCGCRGWD